MLFRFLGRVARILNIVAQMDYTLRVESILMSEVSLFCSLSVLAAFSDKSLIIRAHCIYVNFLQKYSSACRCFKKFYSLRCLAYCKYSGRLISDLYIKN